MFALCVCVFTHANIGNALMSGAPALVSRIYVAPKWLWPLSIYNNKMWRGTNVGDVVVSLARSLVFLSALFVHFLFGVKYSNNKNYRDFFFLHSLLRAYILNSNDSSRTVVHNHFYFYTNTTLPLVLFFYFHCVAMFEIVLFVVCLRTVGINFENVYIKYIASNRMPTVAVMVVVAAVA